MTLRLQSNHWYWLVALVLAVGYLVGGLAPVGLLYFDLLSEWIPAAFKPILLSFLVGLLGANTQLSIHFARDVNAVMSGSQATLPSCFEFLGYALKQLWGGLAAVFFVLAVKLGFVAAMSGSGANLRLPAIVLISFCAGLRAFTILKGLAGIAKAGDG
ncbi:MAG: hypothetical protein HC801_10885 [Nitrospira sp.]|nr:hypothetical protein [Nitrospira sp.]